MMVHKTQQIQSYLSLQTHYAPTSFCTSRASLLSAPQMLPTPFCYRRTHLETLSNHHLNFCHSHPSALSSSILPQGGLPGLHIDPFSKPTQRHHFANNSPYSQGYGLSSSHVRMWELNHKEGRALKNWCFQTVVLERTLESPLDYKEIKSQS